MTSDNLKLLNFPGVFVLLVLGFIAFASGIYAGDVSFDNRRLVLGAFLASAATAWWYLTLSFHKQGDRMLLRTRLVNLGLFLLFGYLARLIGEHLWSLIRINP